MSSPFELILSPEGVSEESEWLVLCLFNGFWVVCGRTNFAVAVAEAWLPFSVSRILVPFAEVWPCFRFRFFESRVCASITDALILVRSLLIAATWWATFFPWTLEKLIDSSNHFRRISHPQTVRIVTGANFCWTVYWKFNGVVTATVSKIVRIANVSHIMVEERPNQ